MQLSAPAYAPPRLRLAPVAGIPCTLWPVQRQHHAASLHRSSHGACSTQAQQHGCAAAGEPWAAPAPRKRHMRHIASVSTAASSSSSSSSSSSFSGPKVAVRGGSRQRRSITSLGPSTRSSSSSISSASNQTQSISSGTMPSTARQQTGVVYSSSRGQQSSGSSSSYPTFRPRPSSPAHHHQQQPGVYTLTLKWYHRATIQQLHDGLLQRAGGGYADVAALEHMLRQASEPDHALLTLQALEAVRSARVAQGRMEYFTPSFAAQFVQMVRRCAALDVLLEGMQRGGVYGLLLSRKRLYPLMREWAQQGRVSAVEAVFGALPAAGIPHDRINIYILVRALANNGKKAEAAQLVEEWTARGMDLKPTGVRLVQADGSEGEDEAEALRVVQGGSE